MKTTAVVESLSTIQPDVLFQRLPAYFKIFNLKQDSNREEYTAEHTKEVIKQIY